MSADSIPHHWIAILAAGLGAAFFTLAGMRLFTRTLAESRRRYTDGTALALDALYISLPAINLLYLSLLFLLAGWMAGGWVTGDPWLGLGFGCGAFLCPRFLLIVLKRRRDAMFGMQLVDALVNISNSLRAGFSLPQAIELIGREMPNPMGQEMRIVSQELRLGVSVEDALANLLERMPGQDLDLVVTAAEIVRDVGGNLTEVFDNIAHTIRERHRVEDKLQALTAQGRLQAMVLCGLPPAIGGALALVAPQMFAPLYSTAPGWAVMGSVVVLMALAAAWIRKIVRISV